MDNSVIISSIVSRVEYYTNVAGISSDVEKKYIKNKVLDLESNQTQPLLLYIKRLFQSFDIAMGEKRTTAKMYLEGDLKYLDEVGKTDFSKNNSRENIVQTMNPNLIKTNQFTNDTDSLSTNEVSGMSNSHKLTKIDSTSNAYKLYSNAA
ncbi:MAG: hypothetical protein HFI87_01160 [Bacilli bacterium]|nr:hypothetical protein [Bacilli bacterium]